MENLIPLLMPALLAVGLVRALVTPVQLGLKLAVHSACGFLCLWLLDLAAPVTGMVIPINAVTVFIAGVTGLPGIAVLAMLAV